MELWVILIAYIPLILLLTTDLTSVSKRQRETKAQLVRVERKLQVVLDHLGIVEPEPHLPEVMSHLGNGKKIQAIKAYRQATGEGLVEAKEAVERLARQHGF